LLPLVRHVLGAYPEKVVGEPLLGVLETLGVFAHLVVALVFKTGASRAARPVPDGFCESSLPPACRPLVRGLPPIPGERAVPLFVPRRQAAPPLFCQGNRAGKCPTYRPRLAVRSCLFARGLAPLSRLSIRPAPWPAPAGQASNANRLAAMTRLHQGTAGTGQVGHSSLGCRCAAVWVVVPATTPFARLHRRGGPTRVERLRAAGWRCAAFVPGRSWNRRSRPRLDRHPLIDKRRWEARSLAEEPPARVQTQDDGTAEEEERGAPEEGER
jgi:hypothetical protein